MKGAIRAASLAVCALVLAVVLLGTPTSGVGNVSDSAYAMADDHAANPVVRSVAQAPAMDTSANFAATADTYLRSGAPNTSEGASTFMRLQASGDNRGLVSFDQAAIDTFIGSGTVVSAKLRLTITDINNNWGPSGRTVDVHRLTANWTEGNGFNVGGSPSTNGTGSGATWNCAIDSDISNQQKNCSGTTEWEMGMPNNPSVHPWVPTATDNETITNGQAGVVEWTVTTDVAAFHAGTAPNYGWIVKKTDEGQAGQVEFGSRQNGTSSNRPVLVIVVTPAATNTPTNTPVPPTDTPTPTPTFTPTPTPTAVDDPDYTATGNIQISVPAASGVLVNDTAGSTVASFGPTTGAETPAGSPGTSAGGGHVTVNSNGSFSYDPPAGFTGTDTFQYTLTTGPSATVTITVSDMIWFINNTPGACVPTVPQPCDGRLTHPIITLASFEAENTGPAPAPQPGHTIFLYAGVGPYASSVTLRPSQKLIGQGASDSIYNISGITQQTYSDPLPPTGGVRPTIAGTVTMATGSLVRGLDILSGTSTGITGTGVTSLTVAEVSVASTTGTAVRFTGATTSSFSFTSVASNGAPNGIFLSNAAGSSFAVTGTGAAGSGGTIQQATGADGATAGIGIYLDNASNVSLAWMQLNDFQNFAIRGTGVSGFTLNNSVISGVNGTNDAGGFNEGSVSFTDLTGSAAITNSGISGGFADNVRVINSSGTLNRITFSTVTIGANSTTNGNDGIVLEGSGSAVLNVTVQNSTFTSARGDLFQLTSDGSGGGDLVFTGNTLSNNHPSITTGGGGVTIAGGAIGAITMNVANNTFRDAVGSAVLIVKSPGAGSLTGSVTNNTIGVAALPNSGSLEGSGLRLVDSGGGPVTVAITNNQISQYNNFGIDLQAGAGVVQSGSFNTTVTGNTISNPGNNPAQGGIFQGIGLNSGVTAGDSFLSCSDIRTNSILGSGRNSGTDFRLRQRQSTTVRLPGYAGANTDTTAVVAFVSGNNGGASGAAAVNSPPGGGFIGTGTACP